MKDQRRNGNDGRNENLGSNGDSGSGAHPSPDSHSSHIPPPTERLLPPRGDYRTLLSFQKAEVISDITFRFAHQYLARSDRTIDQQIRHLKQAFLQQGGLRERMTRARLAYRNGAYGKLGSNGELRGRREDD